MDLESSFAAGEEEETRLEEDRRLAALTSLIWNLFHNDYSLGFTDLRKIRS